MRDHIVMIAAAGARNEGGLVRDRGASQREVAIVCMRHARGHFLAPDESEAFAASVAALYELYPDDETLRQEVAAIGDRNKIMQALVAGVPVDFDRVELTSTPDAAIGLVDLWHEAESGAPHGR